ncbi:hypothetical protein D515_01013 [Grimontia indica]|uniref:Uncharacterized protein n=1 Tax=Grimontia indica TaxID=1056512 RepID=R1IX64_9GAMM|nr:hypothetical protein D515_01013 [Grimontia indica]
MLSCLVTAKKNLSAKRLRPWSVTLVFKPFTGTKPESE